jgi:hypothetical protein
MDQTDQLAWRSPRHAGFFSERPVRFLRFPDVVNG